MDWRFNWAGLGCQFGRVWRFSWVGDLVWLGWRICCFGDLVGICYAWLEILLDFEILWGWRTAQGGLEIWLDWSLGWSKIWLGWAFGRVGDFVGWFGLEWRFYCARLLIWFSWRLYLVGYLARLDI